MIRVIVSLLIILGFSASSLAETIAISHDDSKTIFLNKDDFYLVENPELIKVDRSGNRIVISPKVRNGLTSITVVGENTKTYVIQISPDSASKILGSGNKRAYQGYLEVKRLYDRDVELNNYYDYSLGLNLQLAENSNFDIKYSSTDRQTDAEEKDRLYLKYMYKNYYLLKTYGSEPGIWSRYYQSAPLKVNEIGYADSDFRFALWQGSPFLSSKSYPVDSLGSYLYKDLDWLKLDLSYAQNEFKNAYSSGLNYGFFGDLITQQFIFSQTSNANMYDLNTNLNLNDKSENFKLRLINLDYSIAPKGVDGIYFNHDSSAIETVQTYLDFSTRKIDRKDLEDIEYIPGVFSIRPSYGYRLYDTNVSHDYRLDANYNTDLVSSSINISRQELLEEKSNYAFYNESISPKLNLYVHGDRTNGYFLKNELFFSKNYDDLIYKKESERFNIGLFRSYYSWVVGGYYANGFENYSSRRAQSSGYGGEISYRKSGKRIGFSFERLTSNEEGHEEYSYKNSFNYFADYTYKNHKIYGRVKYLENIYSDVYARSSTYGFIGYIYSFDGGPDTTVVDAVKNTFRNASINFYEDVNANGVKDKGEPEIKNIKVTLYNPDKIEKESDSSGEVTFWSLSEQNHYFQVDELSIPNNMSLDRKDIYIDLRRESSINVGLFKYKTELMKIYDQNNELNLTYPIVSICSNGQKFYRYDINKDSVTLYYPHNLSCVGQIDLEKIESNLVVENESIVKGIKTLRVKQYNKVLYGDIVDKNNKGITGTFLFNGQDVMASSGSFQIEIKPFNGDLNITSNKYKKCLLSSPLEYKSLPDQLKLKIVCQ